MARGEVRGRAGRWSCVAVRVRAGSRAARELVGVVQSERRPAQLSPPLLHLLLSRTIALPLGQARHHARLGYLTLGYDLAQARPLRPPRELPSSPAPQPAGHPPSGRPQRPAGGPSRSHTYPAPGDAADPPPLAAPQTRHRGGEVDLPRARHHGRPLARRLVRLVRHRARRRAPAALDRGRRRGDEPAARHRQDQAPAVQAQVRRVGQEPSLARRDARPPSRPPRGPRERVARRRRPQGQAVPVRDFELDRSVRSPSLSSASLPLVGLFPAS